MDTLRASLSDVSIDKRLVALIEQAAQRLQHGEAVDLEQLARDFPSHADALRELLPTIATLIGIAGRSDNEQSCARSIGKYQLMAKLGAGGMGTVYMAVHRELQKIVALKMLLRERVMDPQAVARFQREMRAIGRFDHPNIVRATDAGQEDGTHYLIMEYVDGVDLGEFVRRRGRLPIADACEIVRQAAVGIQFIHDHGLIHRDVKPSNLMLMKRGEVKILDLGLARLVEGAAGQWELTGTGQMLGTIDYMAPEQGDDSRAADERVDIYSLGATLFKLLTGRSPLASEEGGSPLQKLKAMSYDIAPHATELRADVPEPLAALLARLLAKNPAERIARADGVAKVLETFAQGSNLAELLQGVATGPVHYLAEAPSVGIDTSAISTSNELFSQGPERTVDTNLLKRGELPPRVSAATRRRWRWPLVAAVLVGSLMVAASILIVRDKSGKETLRAELKPGDTVELVPDGRADSGRAASNRVLLVHVLPTIIGSGEDRIAGIPTPSEPTFDSSRPELPVPLSAGPTDKLSISRLFYCGDDLVKASGNSYRGRSVTLWIPIPDGPQAQVVVVRVEGDIQYVVPTRDLPDGVYCLHTGEFSQGAEAVAPQFCAPFIVRGYGEPETGEVAVSHKGKAVGLSVKIKNKGKGEFDDGFLVMTLQKLSSSGSEFKGRQNIDLKTIPASGEVESVSRWDMSDEEPGTYYFHGHVNYTYLYDANALCHVESEPFEWEGDASDKAPAAIETPNGDAAAKDDRYSVYLGCGNAGGPGTIVQLNLAGEIQSEVHTFDSPNGLAFSGDSLAVGIATPFIGGGQSVFVRKDGSIDHMTLTRKFPAPIAIAVDYDTQEVLVADNDDNTVSRVLADKEGQVELLFRTPLNADHDHFPSMSIAAAQDGFVIFSASDPLGVYRIPLKADQQLPEPLLPGDCGVAADPTSNRWVAMCDDDLKVFEGVDEKATIPCPGGASFWRYQVLSFAPDGSLFVILQTGRGMEIQSVDLDTKKFTSHGVWKGGTIKCLAVGPPMLWPKTGD
jgi:serine/threonine protein kinase